MPKLIVAGLFLLFSVPVWAAGGTFRAWQQPFLWISLLAWILFVLQPAVPRLPSRKTRLKHLLRDPAFWCALMFLALLVVQHLNTGRMLIFDFDQNDYTYTSPPRPGLPWSFSGEESAEMIRWFVPVLTGALLLRHAWKALPQREFLNLICLNGFLNALLAFVHMNLGWKAMYNFQRFGEDVYGSFGYPNHGAMFFILTFALSFGLLLREVFSESTDRDRPTLFLNAIWAPTLFLAANLSTSRSGILGSWLVVGLTLGTLSMIAWPRVHPVQRLTGAIAVVLILAGFAAAFVGFAEPIHLRELRNATVDLNLFTEMQDRLFQVESAFHMWREHPWFGVGGWGYRYLVGNYLPQSEWIRLGIGKANVHNDWMQFLAEFGLIGFLLLLGALAPAARKAFQSIFKAPTLDNSAWANPLRISALWGLVILLLVSQIDIPLRSPALFLHGILLLTLLAPHPDALSVWRPVVDWERLQPPAMRFRAPSASPARHSNLPKTSSRPGKKT